MTSFDLTPSQLEWVMSSKIPRKEGRTLRPIADILNTSPLWFVSRPSILFPRAVGTARRHGAQLHNINTCGSMVGLLDLIDHGAGIGMMATQLAQERIASGALLRLPELKPETLELTLLFHKDQPQSVVRRIADQIVAADGLRADTPLQMRGKPRKAARALV